MSLKPASRCGWHARCSYIRAGFSDHPGRKRASDRKNSKKMRNDAPHSSSARSLLNNNKKTLLHKQASDHSPAKAGLLFSGYGLKTRQPRGGCLARARLSRQGRDPGGEPGQGAREPPQPHFESPQFRQVMQPSIITTAAVLHLPHSWAPSGKCDFAKASVCLERASNSERFSSTIRCW